MASQNQIPLNEQKKAPVGTDKTKSPLENLQDILQSTQYSDPSVADLLYDVLGGGSVKLHEGALCTAVIALTHNREDDIAKKQSQQKNTQSNSGSNPKKSSKQTKTKERRDPMTIVPPNHRLYTDELMILLTAIDSNDAKKLADEKTYKFSSTNNQVKRDSELYRLVTREEYSKHIEMFAFSKKWKEITDLIKHVKGINLTGKNAETMKRYLRNFLSQLIWLNKSNELFPSGAYTVNLNNFDVGGRFNENYFYVQPYSDKVTKDYIHKEECKRFDDVLAEFNEALNKAHGYLDKKHLRDLVGKEKKITDYLNIGCAKSFSNSKVTSQLKECVLVVGVMDYLSDYCMARLNAMESNFKKRVPKNNGGLYTLGSETIVDAGMTHFTKYTTMVEKNLFLQWNSSILFPSLAVKFGSDVVFREIYVDHFLDDTSREFRRKTFVDFFKRTVPQLYEGMFIDKDTVVYVPFSTVTIVGLHASWNTLQEYATVTFVSKADNCAWSKASNEQVLQPFLKKDRKNKKRKRLEHEVGESLKNLTFFMKTTIEAMKDNKKN